MGRRGPAPTPTRVLALRGSWRGKANPSEPRPPPARPSPPTWLSEEARKAFLVLARQLHAIGVVAHLDANALARYATLWVRYRKCEEFVAKHGDTYVARGKPGKDREPGPAIGFKLYPQAKQALALSVELLRLEREYGLTPAARARLSTEGAVEEDETSEYFGSGTGG